MTSIELATLDRGTTNLDAETLDAFAARLDGALVAPDDARFEDHAAIWNGAVTRTPGLIVQCTSSADVAAAVDFARNNNLLVAVRGGGHNVAGTASCDSGLVIDLSWMRDVSVDPDTRRVRAGGGATWADVDAATQPHGLAAPGGLVSRTGIAGLTLGGGLGWLRRKHGLSCDNLVSVEIVTADGEIRTASEGENADLFWGLRGGGGNFGVVTTFEYALHPVGPEVMFGLVLYPIEAGKRVLEGWRAFCEAAPDEVSSIVLCGTVPGEEPFPPESHGRQFVGVAAMHSGAVADGERELTPLGQLGTPLCDFSGPAPYVEVQSNFDADYPDGLRYYWKSLYLEHFDDDAMAEVLALAADRPSPLSTVDVWQLGGAMGRVDADATAFADRRAPYLLGVESNWEDAADDDRNRTWTREACARMERFSSGASYLNFEPDTVLAHRSGSANRQRLAAVKRAYDPDNLFRVNHNVAPA